MAFIIVGIVIVVAIVIGIAIKIVTKKRKIRKVQEDLSYMEDEERNLMN